MYKPVKLALLITNALVLFSPARAGDLSPAIRPTVAAMSDGNIGISRMKVTTQRRDGEWTADVTSYITLDYVRYHPFTYEASIVDGSGNVHTDKRKRPYTASREVSTGDREDTDKYTVTISLVGLFSSRPPAELFIRARVLDASGKVVATSILQPFTPPKD